jgi:hypothetical protein
LIYTIYLSETHDASTLKMVRKATDVDTREHENKDKKNRRTISVSGNNDNLDRYC